MKEIWQEARIQQGARLRKVREKAGYTQEKMSELMGISVSGYKKLENGDNQLTTNRLMLLEQKLNISSDYLLYGRTSDPDEVWTMINNLDDCHKMKMMLRLYVYFIRMRKSADGGQKNRERIDGLIEQLTEALNEEREDTCREES